MIIEFPAPAKMLNLNQREHWTKRAQATGLWRHATFVHARHYINVFNWKLPLGPSTVKFTFPVKSTKTRRDAHNVIPTVKAGVDGLVDAKLFRDDSVEWVTVLDPEFWTGGHVVVEILPRDP